MKLISIIIFIFNLIIFIFPLPNYSLIFPFHTIYLNEIEDLSLYNESITKNIIRNMLESNVYINIKIGTPLQDIKIKININSDDFFIVRPDADFDRKYPKRNGNYYFNQSLSSTFDYQEGKKGDIYFSHPHLSNYAQDNFIFSTINQKKELYINNFKFLLAYQVRESQHGIIGLKGFANIRGREDFLTSLKSYNLTKNYIWYLKYENSTNGNLIIGNFPHDDEYIKQNCNDCVFQKKHFSKIYSNITEKSWLNQWGLNFKNIKIKEKDKYHNVLEECEKCKMAELDPNIGIIKGSKKYGEIIEESLFKKYINQKVCFKDLLNFYKNYEDYNYYYYYCNSSVKNELKKEFNPIIFEHREFKTNFTLDYDDLFFQEQEYIFFKIIFDEYYNFIFGAPFISKYQFVFNSDTKEIGFYSKNIMNLDENKINKNKDYTLLKIFGIIVLGGLLIVIGILIGKKLFGQKRKVKVNELEETFDYKINDDYK